MNPLDGLAHASQQTHRYERIALVSLFDPSRNSFGFLRILLATAVIVSHAWPLGGFGPDPGREFNNLGILAVECFFALSGFLIARSGERLTVGRFLWHRMVRIFPGLWVALLFVALFAAPAVWRASQPLTQYPLAEPGPLGYILNNVFLQNAQQGIGDTLATNPFPSMWNGPLYTLPYEFLCYLLVAALIAFRALGPRSVAILCAATWIFLQLQEFGALGLVDTRQARFTLMFFAGALIYFWREQLLHRRRWWIPVLAGVVVVLSYLTIGFIQVGLIALAYIFIWTGSVLPLHRIGTRRDYSYGMYIYGWPVLQLATFWGLNKLGLPIYLAIVLLASLVLAMASWHLVESRALRTKSMSLPRWLAPVDSPAAAGR